MKRTHHCAQLTKADLNATVLLAGWVDSVRDHGGIIFIDLRDREGVTQVKFDTNLRAEAAQLKSESVVEITGTIKEFQFKNPHTWIQLDVDDPDAGEVPAERGGLRSRWSRRFR